MGTRSRLPLYGEPIFRWRGRGVLSRQDGTDESVSFTAQQLKAGEIVIDTRGTLIPMFETRPLSLVGTTHDGHRIEFLGLRLSHSNSPLGQGGRSRQTSTNWYALSVRVTKKTSSQPHEIVAGLVNCEIQLRPSPVAIRAGHATVHLTQRSDYDTALARARYQNSAMLMANAHCEIGRASVRTRLKLLEDICRLLSFARGTVINWIFYEVRSAKGETLESVHGNRVTRRFSPLAPIRMDDTAEFVEHALPILLADRQYRLRRVISSVHDAKVSGFLETRALAACVTVEYLVTRFGLTRSKRWNAKPLRYRLEFMNREACLGLRQQSISWLVDLRNQLAHEASFLPGRAKWKQYLRAITLMDTMFARLLRYKGPIVNQVIEWNR